MPSLPQDPELTTGSLAPGWLLWTAGGHLSKWLRAQALAEVFHHQVRSTEVLEINRKLCL